MKIQSLSFPFLLVVLAACGTKSELSQKKTPDEIKAFFSSAPRAGKTLQQIGPLNQMKGPKFQKGKVVPLADISEVVCHLSRNTSFGADEFVPAGTSFKITYEGNGNSKLIGGGYEVVGPDVDGYAIWFTVTFPEKVLRYDTHSLSCWSKEPSKLTGAAIAEAVAGQIELP